MFKHARVNKKGLQQNYQQKMQSSVCLKMRPNLVHTHILAVSLNIYITIIEKDLGWEIGGVHE